MTLLFRTSRLLVIIVLSGCNLFTSPESRLDDGADASTIDAAADSRIEPDANMADLRVDASGASDASDVLIPTLCGNGQIDGEEVCDGAPTGSCVDFGFTEGELVCHSNCTLDTSGCNSPCDYHYSTSGDDENPGSPTAPLLSLSLITAAADNTVHCLRRGDTFAVSTTTDVSGKSIGAYGTGDKPIIDGLIPVTFEDQEFGIFTAQLPSNPKRVFDTNGSLPRGSSVSVLPGEWFWEAGTLTYRPVSGTPDDVSVPHHVAFVITSGANQSFRSFELRHFAAAIRMDMSIAPLTDATFSDLTISGTENAFLVVNANAETSGLTISNCIFEDFINAVWWQGESKRWSNVTIADNMFLDSGFGSFSQGIRINALVDSRLERNSFIGAERGSFGINIDNMDVMSNVTVSQNYLVGWGIGVVVRGSQLPTGLDISNNVMRGIGSGSGIRQQIPLISSRYRHNSIANFYVSLELDDPGELDVRNNTLIADGFSFTFDAAPGIDFRSDYNAVPENLSINDTEITLTQWRAMGYDANSINVSGYVADPFTLQDFTPSASSALKAIGEVSDVTTDFSGATRSNPPDIGAINAN